jgi:signal transduction histidine kinase
MGSHFPVAGTAVLAGYILVFGVAALVCFVSVARARLIDQRETRRGMIGILLTSAGWATTHVAFLLAPTPNLKILAYYAGLVVGIAAVGPWLYFCSAYTGRSLHRSATVRLVAVLTFLALVAVKLTNPVHGLYFQAEILNTPFRHLAIHNQPLHWLAMGLAYALAAVGYFMLLELFRQVGHETRPIAVLVGVTGLPIVLDLLALATPLLIDITYEPLGVAAFAIGVLYVYFDDFQAIQVAGEHDDPVIVLDDDDQVRDFNVEAGDLFPTLETGVALSRIAPAITDSLDGEDTVIEIARPGGQRYYQLAANPFSTTGSDLGRAIVLTDITEREQYRNELERQNERLEQFASMISHDLRNPMNVAMSNVELAAHTDGDDEELLETVATALDRMEALVDDLLTLARQGQPIDEMEPVTLSTIVNQCWDVVETKDATYTLAGDLTFHADPERLQQLLENLVRNAIDHGGADVTLTIGSLPDGDGFYVADDGPGIPESDRDSVFEHGFTNAEEGTGFGLSIVKEIVDAHGWGITITESDHNGAQFNVTGVRVCEDHDIVSAGV